MFQLISITLVLILIGIGVYAAYEHFIVGKESSEDSTKPSTPAHSEVTPSVQSNAILTSVAAPVNLAVTSQITDAVTQTPEKAKKRRFYPKKPKATAGKTSNPKKQKLK